MSQFRPKYITFDCYGTLTDYQMGPMGRQLFADRIASERMDAFLAELDRWTLADMVARRGPMLIAISRTRSAMTSSRR